MIPIKKYRAANCEYLWRYDVARPLSLPETNTVIVFDENAPLVDFSEIYIYIYIFVEILELTILIFTCVSKVVFGNEILYKCFDINLILKIEYFYLI